MWAERVGTDFVGSRPGADPAAVAFDAIEAARSRGADVVILDTAGRLHTQSDLMAELAKIERVVARKQPGAPHETLLVLDASQGQNALAQARTFHARMKLTGLAITKLDGTAKGGILFHIARALKVPIRLVGETASTPGDYSEGIETGLRALLGDARS